MDQPLNYEDIFENMFSTQTARTAIKRVSEGPRTDAAREQISQLRTKLLNLNKSNKLLNFRHSEKARTHVRVIDELPDILQEKLFEGMMLTFKSLPEPAEEPKDEHADSFLMALEEARENDEAYKEKIARLDDDPNLKEFRRAERELKDRLRTQLGMPPRAHTDIMSIAEYAKAHGFSPNYELPKSSKGEVEARHTDNEIQTLLLPDQMERKLSGVYQQARSTLQETGVNTLYVAFGFLEWTESPHSDQKLYAPLILHPVEITRNLSGTQYRYSINSVGEESEINLTLSERLKHSFSERLPELREDDTPEDYLVRVQEEIVGRHPNWRVRRYITIGHFAFARLVMYKDLDPERWPENVALHTHAALSAMLGGSNEDTGTSAEPYDVDDPKIASKVPTLVADADSSQFSAIVDVMQGKNLAIEGPPGTGKSQTITNILAAAMGNGKRVLFIAEKMAALNVVKSRLDNFGLGEFVMELHSTKARKKDILEGLKARIDIQGREKEPEELSEAIQTLENLKKRLNRYAEVLNTEYGGLGMSIQQILWADQCRRDQHGFPYGLHKMELPDATIITPYAKAERQEYLRVLENHVQEFNANFGGVDKHPWYGIGKTEIGPFDQETLHEGIDDWIGTLKRLRNAAEEIPGIPTTLDETRYLVKITKSLPEPAGDLELLSKLADSSLREAVRDLCESLTLYTEAAEILDQAACDPGGLYNNSEILYTIADEAHELKVEEVTSADLPAIIDDLNGEAANWRGLSDNAGNLCSIFGITEAPTPKKLIPLIKAARLVRDAERRILLLRNPFLNDELAAEDLHRGRDEQIALKNRLADLEENYIIPVEDKSAPEMLRQHADALRDTGFLSGLKGRVRHAKQYYRMLTRNKPPSGDRAQIANNLERIAETIEAVQAFNANSRFFEICGDRFMGLETDFQSLIAVNDFSIKIRNTLAGIDESSRAARRLLLEGSIGDLDDLIALTGDEMFNRLDSTIKTLSYSPPDIPIYNYVKEAESRAEAVESLEAKVNQTGLSGTVILGNAADLAKRDTDRIKARSAIDDNLTAQKTLGKLFDGVETDHSLLRQTLDVADSLDNLNLPDALRDHFFDPNYSGHLRDIRERTHSLANIHEELDTTIEETVSAGGIDLPTFFGKNPEEIGFESLLERLVWAHDNISSLNSWVNYIRALQDVRAAGLTPVLDAYDAVGQSYQGLEAAYSFILYRSLARSAFLNYPELKHFSGVNQQEAQRHFRELDSRVIKLQRQHLRAKLARNQAPRGNSEGKASDRTELGLIHAELNKKKKHVPIRQLLTRAGTAVQTLKPCFMMSPLSVAQYLEPGQLEFDLVVIDEASQVRPEDALCGLARADQVVVVGDPKQLPPTSFFEAKEHIDDEEEEEADAAYIESILDLAMRTWHPYRRLLWHYRSRNGELIAFSNEKFYDGELIVFPGPRDNYPDFGVSYVNVEDGYYRGHMNVPEARRVAKDAINFMARHPDRSLGVVAMNKKQTELIQDEVNRILSRDHAAYNYISHWEDKEGGLQSFFVKNLENVQGDERDVIFISTTYGPDPDSKRVLQRFGPINSAVGHRRLNVLFTRAKEQVILYSSMNAHDIKVNEPNTSRGRQALRDYLEYAATKRLHGGEKSGEPDSDFERFVKDKLEARGYEVYCQVGVAGYFIDLAIKHPAHPHGYIMGVECDGATYHSAKSARDRDRLREEVLRNLGWEIYRIWSTDWFNDPNTQIARLEARLAELLRKRAVTTTDTQEFEQDVFESVGFSPQSVDGKQDSATADKISLEDSQQEGQDLDESSVVQGNVVEPGDLVKYLEIDKDGDYHYYQALISSSPSDPDSGILNIRTPLAQALLDSEEGEEVEVNLPKGRKSFYVERIEKANSTASRERSFEFHSDSFLSEESEAYVIKGKGVDGRALYVSKKRMKVLRGSIARGKTTNSCPESLCKSRQRLIQNKVLEKTDNGGYLFTKDKIFPSPSHAAGVIRGASVNGWTEWVHAESGETLGAVERR